MKKKKKVKIRYKRVFVFFLFLFLLISIICYILKTRITNIYIIDNYYLKDQEIIEIAKLQNYPSTFSNLSFTIEKRLENNILIENVEVKKKWFTNVYIYVKENSPLFYYLYDNKTVLKDGSKIDTIYSVPTVLNYVKDTIYNEFIKKMSDVSISVLTKISEIEYKPSEVDEELFLLTMNDGNYVYINLDTFYKLNKYLEIIQNFENKKGVLYLDYGNNFEVLE